MSVEEFLVRPGPSFFYPDVEYFTLVKEAEVSAPAPNWATFIIAHKKVLVEPLRSKGVKQAMNNHSRRYVKYAQKNLSELDFIRISAIQNYTYFYKCNPEEIDIIEAFRQLYPRMWGLATGYLLNKYYEELYLKNLTSIERNKRIRSIFMSAARYLGRFGVVER